MPRDVLVCELTPLLCRGNLMCGRMLRVVGLSSPDALALERRARHAISPPQSSLDTDSRSSVRQAWEKHSRERAVALVVELLHQDGVAVAEEANQVLR